VESQAPERLRRLTPSPNGIGKPLARCENRTRRRSSDVPRAFPNEASPSSAPCLLWSGGVDLVSFARRKHEVLRSIGTKGFGTLSQPSQRRQCIYVQRNQSMPGFRLTATNYDCTVEQVNVTPTDMLQLDTPARSANGKYSRAIDHEPFIFRCRNLE